MKYEWWFYDDIGKLNKYKDNINLNATIDIIKRDFKSEYSWRQIIKDKNGNVVFDSKAPMVEKKDKPKRVRSFNGLPGFECKVSKVTYICDGEGLNPSGTKLNAFLMSPDTYPYLVYVPKQPNYPYPCFIICDKTGDNEYTQNPSAKMCVPKLK